MNLINPLATKQAKNKETASIDIYSVDSCPVCGATNLEECLAIEDQIVRVCLECSVAIPKIEE